MKTSTSEESLFNQLAAMEAQVERMMETAIRAGHYQLAFISLRSLKVFINLAKEAALDTAVEKEEAWPPPSQY